jgi:hypothetical protein
MQCEVEIDDLVGFIQDTIEEIGGLNALYSNLDVNAILNEHLIRQAEKELNEFGVTKDFFSNNSVYFHNNYIDCPLRYSEEIRDKLIEELEENEVLFDDLTSLTKYVLSEMEIDKQTIEGA